MEQEIQEKQGTFFIGEEHDPKAQVLFEENDNTMVITSTFVAPSEREQGLGGELIDYAVNYARKHKLKIDPVCSFAREVIENTPEYQVVLKA
ncbi:GNAT family N-acetyltransferase [Halobacillus litoralis]|uniref:GNAT family N-acetyltransferase n=1 Tax=Halobacillus litoralis TaxID=45668 RepID=UPI001CFE93F5|nr:GNAT family N-acetyltransferase [Halobacillus litoralis]WLR48223.1 GNAT family N-acetyltransferase [Halobacillus litoralis]